MRSAEISRRLKAARWLAGGEDANGKPKALSVKELAERDPLPANKIRANRLEEIEQLTVTPPPMELEQIAKALGMPDDWFAAETAAEDHLYRVLDENAGKLDILIRLATRDMPSDQITQLFLDLADTPDEVESTGSDTGSASGG